MARIGVFGAGGRLGRHLADAFAAAGHEVAAWTRPEVDIEDAARVAEAVRGLRPDVLVNAASLTDVDRSEAEPLQAWRTNAQGVAHVAEAATDAGAFLVHVSTDYVFDGERTEGAYVEDDPVRPVNRYARSKAAGEEAARLLARRCAVVRVAWLFGGTGIKPDFVTWTLGLARRGKPIPAVSDQWGCPTYLPDISAWLLARISDIPEGTFHVVGPEATTRVEMARMILETAGVAGDLRPTPWAGIAARATRPRRLVLSIDRARRAGYAPRPLRDAVEAHVRSLARTQESSR